MFIPLYKCLIRSHFDYAVTVLDPYILKLIVCSKKSYSFDS